jgi:hypothetical protein
MLDGVPQFSPAMAVWPVVRLTGSPRVRLSMTQAAASGSTDSKAGAGTGGRLR